MQFIPKEIDLVGIYLPPALAASILGVAAALLTALLLNRYRLSRFFSFPPLVFLGLAVIYTCLIGTFLIPI